MFSEGGEIFNPKKLVSSLLSTLAVISSSAFIDDSIAGPIEWKLEPNDTTNIRSEFKNNSTDSETEAAVFTSDPDVYPPGLTFGVPTSYGLVSGDVFVGISYSADASGGLFNYSSDNSNKDIDGSMMFALGLGDDKKLALETTVGIISLLCQDGLDSSLFSGESCFGADGTVGVKLHKRFSKDSFISGAAIGYSDLVKWGEASDYSTIYGVASKDFKINNRSGLFSLGLGTGNFRSNSDVANSENSPNIFAGIGYELAPRLSLATSWNGNQLSSGFGLTPFNFPLAFTFGMTDLTDEKGDGPQYSINAGYTFTF